MVKAILFDFDGVLTTDKTGSQSILRYLSKATNTSLETLKAGYYKYNRGLLYGEFTHKDIWNDFCEDIGRDIAYSVLVDSFRNTPMDSEMISFVKELKPFYKIGMITDNKCDRIEEIISHFGLTELFDEISVSAEYKSGKESRLIFDQTAQKLAVDPRECVFIDNSPKNLVVPRQIGMQTLLFDDEQRCVEAFKRTLFDLIAHAK